MKTEPAPSVDQTSGLRPGMDISQQSVEDLTDQNVNTIAALEAQMKSSSSGSERIAKRITAFCGSMLFVYIHLAAFGLWIFFNVSPIFAEHFDPFPFFFLTFIVTLELFFLSAFILISQNEDRKLTERRSHLNLQIGMLTGQENTKMLKMLKNISTRLGLDDLDDPHLAALVESTQPEKLFNQIENASKSAIEK